MRVRRAFPLLLLPLAAAVQCGQRHALDRRVALGWFAAPAAARAAPAPAARPLTFTTSPSGLGAADITLGRGELAAEAGSRVTFHVKGRLIGKNAWVFIDTQEIYHRVQQGERDVVSHALKVFLNICHLFIRIITIVAKIAAAGAKKKRR